VREKELAIRREAERSLLERCDRGEIRFGNKRSDHYTHYYYDWVIVRHRYPPTGTCKWCGGAVEKPARNWHRLCAEEYKILHMWQNTVWLLTGGMVFHGIPCAKCGATGNIEWDHIRPLHENQRDITAHFLDNIQPLCCKCHKIKTAEQAFRRRKPRPQRTTPSLFG
jgi:hypothetical protein